MDAILMPFATRGKLRAAGHKIILSNYVLATAGLQLLERLPSTQESRTMQEYSRHETT